MAVFVNFTEVLEGMKCVLLLGCRFISFYQG